MNPSIFSELPNDLIIKIIKHKTIEEQNEKYNKTFKSCIANLDRSFRNIEESRGNTKLWRRGILRHVVFDQDWEGLWWDVLRKKLFPAYDWPLN